MQKVFPAIATNNWQIWISLSKYINADINIYAHFGSLEILGIQFLLCEFIIFVYDIYRQ